MHCSWQFCAQVSGEGVVPVSGWDYLIMLISILSWCIILSWLLISTNILLCQGQGAQRVASAYGWVKRVFSMVK
jgi:hypothetical protein